MIDYGVFVASSWTNPKEQWCRNSDVRFFPCFSVLPNWRIWPLALLGKENLWVKKMVNFSKNPPRMEQLRTTRHLFAERPPEMLWLCFFCQSLKKRLGPTTSSLRLWIFFRFLYSPKNDDFWKKKPLKGRWNLQNVWKKTPGFQRNARVFGMPALLWCFCLPCESSKNFTEVPSEICLCHLVHPLGVMAPPLNILDVAARCDFARSRIFVHLVNLFNFEVTQLMWIEHSEVWLPCRKAWLICL